MENYAEKAIELVRNYIRSINAIPLRKDFDVRIVWFCKTLQNWKAMAITDLPDDVFYEVTYNGNLKQAYIDVYQKMDNVCVSDDAPSPPQPTSGPKYNVNISGLDREDPRRGIQIGDGNYQQNNIF